LSSCVCGSSGTIFVYQIINHRDGVSEVSFWVV
jgi:hypothetical protein